MDSEWEQIAAIGVDAGVVWLGDPCYTMTPDTRYAIANTWDAFVQALITRMGNSDIARFEKQDGWGDVGVAVQSGFGDGVYPVFVRRDASSGRIAALRVEFLPSTDS